MDCLHEVVTRFPPAGMFWDIGGGNGFLAAELQARGIATALLDPGDGVFNAQQRGVRHIVKATLADAGFASHSLAAAGAFDVIEHVDDDTGFLEQVHASLIPGGRFYCTVPALPGLWSAEDTDAGHYRRYRLETLAGTLRRAGFEPEFATYFFTWLVAPVWLLRALPSRLGLVDATDLGRVRDIQADHQLPRALAGVVGKIHAWERRRIAGGRPLTLGTSLLCVARAG